MLPEPTRRAIEEYNGVVLRLPANADVVDAFAQKKVFFGRRNRKPNPRTVFIMRADAPIEPYSCYSVGGNLFSMGAFSYCESELPVGVKVGRYCSIAKGLQVFADRHPHEWVTTSSVNYDFKDRNGYRSFIAAQADFNANEFPRTEPDNKKGPAPVIGNDVWIGQNVQLARGIIIGDGAVIAAGAVVTKDVASYSIVGGVAAKHIKFRFAPEVIQGLLESRWWEHDPSIFQHYDLKDPESFVRDWHSGDYRSPYNPDLVSPELMLELLGRL